MSGSAPLLHDTLSPSTRYLCRAISDEMMTALRPEHQDNGENMVGIDR